MQLIIVGLIVFVFAFLVSNTTQIELGRIDVVANERCVQDREKQDCSSGLFHGGFSL